MARELEGKVIVVAGAGTGLGRAAVHLFARAGARVVMAARTETKLAETRALLAREELVATPVVADLAVEGEARRTIQVAVEQHGGLDGLFACTGGYEPGGSAEMTGDSLDRMLASNLRAQLEVARAAIGPLTSRGGGSIVITSAVFGALSPAKKLLAYSISKGAALAASTALAADLRERNIRVNALCPGGISHDYQPDRPPAAGRTLGKGPARPDDVARAALFLLSDESFWISGAAIPVDGGWAVARDAG